MIKAQLTIINKLGLHARAAAKLVATTSTFVSSIQIAKDGQQVDAKSIMSVMMLAANKGTTLEFAIEGEDEQLAFDAVKALIDNKFQEAE